MAVRSKLDTPVPRGTPKAARKYWHRVAGTTYKNLKDAEISVSAAIEAVESAQAALNEADEDSRETAQKAVDTAMSDYNDDRDTLRDARAAAVKAAQELERYLGGNTINRTGFAYWTKIQRAYIHKGFEAKVPQPRAI